MTKKTVKRVKRQTRSIDATHGTLFGNDTMFLRVAAGTAKGDDGSEYELSTGMNGAPIIRDKKSGLWWSVGWQKLIEFAIADGINNPDAFNGQGD